MKRGMRTAMTDVTDERITKLALAVGTLSMAVADLAHLCDVRGHVFDAESAKRFDSQWDMCQEMLADVLKEERDD